MRPITPSARSLSDNRMSYRARGYRALSILLVIGLLVIGLVLGFIRLSQTISNISENIPGRDSRGQDSEILKNSQIYYREDLAGGLLGKLRTGRRSMDRIQNAQ